MERRTIIAIILIGIMYIIWFQYLNRFSPSQTENIKSDRHQQSESVQEHDQEDDALSKELYGEDLLDHSALTPIDTVDTIETSREIVVDTDLYRAVLSTRGGTIQSWRLKAFEGVDKKWVELLPPDAEGALGLAMKTMEGDVDFSQYVFICEAESLILDEAHPNGTVNMSLHLKNGSWVEKTLQFQQGSYSIDMDVSIAGMDRFVPMREYELLWNSGLKSTEVNVKEDMQLMVACALMGSDVAKFNIGGKDQAIERREDGTCGWLGIRNKYFLISMIPRSQAAKGIRVNGRKSKVKIDNKLVDVKNYSVGLRMPLSEEKITKHGYEVYLGPQSYSLLKSYGVGLEKCMDMGWTLIRPISRVILAFFVFVHKFIPNYGLVIIIFSVFLKVLFYPLTHKQLEATKKMQELQPQLAALKEKYKKDPQRLNKETMTLYKQAGANPLGGCFPLLLQMPVFFSLFSVFRNTIELRRAEFIFWIKDLSVKDPYLILPIVMAIVMFIQQKMTMKDPKQAAMVYLMPLVMFFFFMNFASGLVLYWTIYNVLSILQQLFVEKRGKSPVK
jgi:YidC/Oxa1 family membrane protein insertase